MRVKELVLDGFKSYATRTVITDWDASFNCITGLNGSGKSNILDAICFVLGITSTATMRAQNQQELIYKRGQAGITKASVSIVFDNTDRDRSPPSFEEYATISVTRQVAVGGTSKYLINGHRATQSDVQKLFQSVQLNVNNPNFLILQGQVTKVLNMKPQEILALIEEAAGTRMYETRREIALRDMGRKETKITEIKTLLAEEIEPKLQKLRNEKRDFLDYQNCVAAIDRAEKIIVAHDFLQMVNQVQNSENTNSENRARFDLLQSTIERLEQEVEDLLSSLERLKKERESRSKGGVLQSLEQQAEKLGQDLAQLQGEYEMKTSQHADEKARLAASQTKLREAEDQNSRYEVQVKDFKADFEKLKSGLEALKSSLQQRQDLLRSLQTGISTSNQKETGYANEAKVTRQKIAGLQTQISQAEQRKQELAKNFSEQDVAKASKEVEKLKERLTQFDAELAEIDEQIAQRDIDGHAANLDELRHKEAKLSREAEALARQIEQNVRQCPQLEFHMPGFTRESVKGVLVSLYRVKAGHNDKAIAIQQVAGAKQYNLVVDSDTTGQKIISSGMKRRITVIPLNKISGDPLSAAKVAAAKEMGAPGDVELALDLLDFDEELKPAMAYVFGRTVVCKDDATAKRVTFSGPRVRSITLEGAVYDTNGTLRGGDVGRSNIDRATREYVELSDRMAQVDRQRKALAGQMSVALQADEQVSGLRKTRDLKKYERDLVERNVSSGSAAQLLAEAAGAGTELEQITSQIETATASLAEAESYLKNVEKDVKDFANNRDGKLAELQAEIADMKRKESELSKQVSEGYSEYSEIQSKLVDLQSTIATEKQRIGETEALLAELVAEMRQNETKRQALTRQSGQLDRELSSEREQLYSMDGEYQTVEANLETKRRGLVDSRLQQQSLQHELETFEAQLAAKHRQINELKTKFTWLETDRVLLGQENTPYDFQRANLSQCRNTLQTEQARLAGLKNKVNERVMAMIDSMEAKESELRMLITALARDRRNIETTLQSINEKKDEALKRTHGKVSQDLGRIFGDLLPNSSARLDAVDENDITRGLNVRVRLGAVWKESLTELSGGQRSLVALSLILALLQFRPAPMYILDEVDAALDLHHTQNIGHIIKTRFQDSQFIVVSLKDGMFTNANRIFQTKFEEGKSKVLIKQ